MSTYGNELVSAFHTGMDFQPPAVTSTGPSAVRARSRGDGRDIQAYHMFDAAYPSPANLTNWGHVCPETPEDIVDPHSLETLRTTSLYEFLNDDSLNGMVNVGAESIIGTGPMTDVQCGFDLDREKDLNQYIEYIWSNWFRTINYPQKLRTAQKDLMLLGEYFRRVVHNPRKPFGIDVILVSPFRIANPNIVQNGDYIAIDGETVRVVNGIAYDMFGNERFFCVMEKPFYQSGWYDPTRFEWVSADVMSHVFDPQFSEQCSGFPMTTPSLEKGVLRRQYEKEELAAARLGATLSGYIKTNADFRAILEMTLDGQDHDLVDTVVEALSAQFHPDAIGRKIGFPIGNMLNCPPGAEVHAFDTKHPNSGFSSHRLESLKGQGRSLRMTEFMATGSASPHNYASVQKESQQWSIHKEVFRQDIEIMDLEPVFQMFVERASIFDARLSRVFTGEIFPVMSYFYWKQDEHADPVKQATFWKILHRMGVYGCSDIMKFLGLDPERQKQIVKRDQEDMAGYYKVDKGDEFPIDLQNPDVTEKQEYAELDT